MKQPEQLFTCEKCGQANFTARGLKSHNCAKRVAAKGSPLTLARLDSMPLVVVEENKFDLVNRFHEQARLSMAQSCAFMILAGFELNALRKVAKHGEWEQLFAGARAGKSRNVATFAFSYDTAGRYMRLAEAAKKNIPALRSIPLGDVTLDQLSEEQRAIVLKAVHKTGDGNTFQQLAWDWNLAKKPRASGVNGGDTSESEPASDPLSPEAVARDMITLPLRSVFTEFFHKGRSIQWTNLSHAEMNEIDGMLLEMREALKPVLTKKFK